MTVSTIIIKNSYSGNGTLHSFAYGFKIFADADLDVIIRSSSGTETVKTLNTHYVVTNAGNDSGGNVLFKFNTGTNSDAHFSSSDFRPASGETVLIRRSLGLTQSTDYVANDPFAAEDHETALDRLTFISQEIQEELDRSFKVSRTNTITTSEFATSASDRANKLLSFDGSGDLTVTEGKVDTVTASASAVSAGSNPTASATYTASSGALALALGLPTGATGATGNSAGLQMTFSNSTSDADPGGGKLALNNGTLSSVSVMFFDDADDNSADISTFVQSFDDASNATARGLIHIEKEGAASTFALYKVTGAVTDASGYTKVPVTHLVSNGTFSNADGLRVDFSYSGNDGAGSLTEVSGDTSPQLGGNLDMNGQDIVTTSNATIDLAPHGTGTVVVRGNTNSGSIVFNCESNTHGQTVKAQPHSASVTNTLLLPAGSNSTLVSESATQTLTNKSIAASQLTSLSGANIVATNAQNTFTKAQLPSTYTAALSATSGVLDYDTYQNFIITLASGSNTLAAVTTEASQVGQTGVIIFIQPSSSSAGTISLHGDYETAEAAGLTLSSANNDYDVVPYIVKADNSILLGTAQLNFG